MIRTTPLTPPALPPAQQPSGKHRRHFATSRTVAALVLREMSTRYGRTPGGYLWSILEPLAAILFLSIGFSLVIRSPSLGTSFLLFYATGFLPFNLYQSISNTTARAITYSKPLLKFPAVTWVDAVSARFLLNSLSGILVTFVLITGILAVIDHRAGMELPPTVQAMALAMLLGLGVGTVNCVLLGLYPLWEIAWSVITRPLFIASGILFLYEELPPLAQQILWYNPLFHISGLMRTGFYPSYTASYVSIIYVLLVSLALLTLGLILMGRYHRDILNR
ncbi:ABC transporter permease [Phaeobacter inhibens]|uniref:ABC transporter permease n=1 Tax=Phaeobacter inhibens TaxID=221822 RepID=UPI000C9C19D5|nr:ABC transporter permease [Phaeobacter inhibens]AUQ68757.1 ABC-type polysaccharide/polyol phosphate export system, permease component [Phaeobacter inhibens]